MRYLNRLRLKQDSLVIERKETGKSLYDFAMVVLSLMSLHGLSLKTSLRRYLLLSLMNKLLTIRNGIIKYLIPIYRIKIHQQTWKW